MNLKETIEKLKNKEISSVELVRSCLESIKEKDGELNSFLFIDKENAFEKAKEADKELVLDSEKAFLGVPFAVKDNILVEEAPCTAGSKILDGYKAPYSATAISKLAGGVVVGKTNMDEFAMGSSTENSAYGPTKNPCDTERAPGGSSGGSAAAVSAGLIPFALGSDTGGSIRQPASFCGVVGFKPTYGAVSRHGLIAMASSLDQIGPITKTVQDAKLVFEQITGKDEMDSTSVDIHEHGLRKKPSELKLGIVKEFLEEGLDDRVKEKVLDAVNVYKKMGAGIKEISLPNALSSLAVYYIIMPAEASSNLARYDGIRYGKYLPEEEQETLMENYLKIRGDNFGPEVKRRIMLGTYILSAGYYDAYYLKAQKVRKLIEEDFVNAFKEVDAIISPTTPTPAFKLGAKTKNPLEMYLSDIYTVGANLAGLPAISVPVGSIDEAGTQLPVGMQVIGKERDDLELLDIAELYEKETRS
ncbi:MAG: Asp-tRNA(Asn)/Glu-tRNA(Gln) amidotransferase subunit GatA [Candidatus Spechtbacterales bacterium]